MNYIFSIKFSSLIRTYLITAITSFFAYLNTNSQTNVYVHPENIIIDNFEGWGTSMAWWAEDAGDYHKEDLDKLDELANILINELNYTTFRYNIGGSCDDDKENNCPAINLGLNPQRTIPNMNEPDRGLNQRRMLTSLSKIGKEGNKTMKFEAFTNSPPYWMLKSGSPTGGRNGTNNLMDDKYDDFAEYIVRAVGYLNDDLKPYGFDIESIEPFNEPYLGWSFNDDPTRGKQEGCSYNSNNQIKLVRALHKEIEDQEVSAFMSANDNFSISSDIIKLYKENGLLDKIGSRLNFHDYSGNIAARKEVHALAKAEGKNVWISEGGPIGIEVGGDPYRTQLNFMNRISQDLKYMKPKRWIDWQIVDTHPNWTAIDYYDYMENGNITPNKRFYLMQHFTKHISIGDDQLFSTSDIENVVAFRSKDETKLTIVTVNNTNSSTSFNVNLRDFRGTRNATVERWVTNATNYNHQKLDNLSLTNTGRLNTTLEAYSIATFEVPIKGTRTSRCTASVLSADYDINNDDTDWLTGTSITINAGTSLKLSPKSSSEGGDWVWSGSATLGTSQEQVITPASSTMATATYTNTCGEITTITYNINVTPTNCPPTTITPLVYTEGIWTETNQVITQPGDLVRLGPAPEEGGSWSWSGCDIDAQITSRTPSFFPTSECTITATYTNPCGRQSSVDFEIVFGFPEGKYQIVSRSSRKCLVNLEGNTEEGTAVVQYTRDDSADENWIINHLSNGVYEIQHESSGLYADISAASIEAGARNILWPNNNNSNQKWKIIAQGNDYYHIINLNSGLYLDISGASGANNTQTIQWNHNNGFNQDWSFIAVERKNIHKSKEIDQRSTPKISEFTVYPNPSSSGTFNIHIPSKFTEGTLEIFDIQGRMMLRESLINETTKFNGGHLENGIYLIKISINSDEISKRIIINQ